MKMTPLEEVRSDKMRYDLTTGKWDDVTKGITSEVLSMTWYGVRAPLYFGVYKNSFEIIWKKLLNSF